MVRRCVIFSLCLVLLVAVGCAPSAPSSDGGTGGTDGSDSGGNGSAPIPDAPLPDNPDESPTEVLTLTPETHDFGSSGIGQPSVAQIFTVTNTGDAAVRIAAVQISGLHPLDFAIVVESCTGRSLPPLAVCTVTVQFQARAVGPRSATLEIVPQDPTIETPTASLAGQGVFF